MRDLLFAFKCPHHNLLQQLMHVVEGHGIRAQEGACGRYNVLFLHCINQQAPLQAAVDAEVMLAQRGAVLF